MSDFGLNSSTGPGDHARALYCCVQAIRDGYCPKCGHLDRSVQFESGRRDYECPVCLLYLTGDEAEAAIDEFRTFMKKNFQIFEGWLSEYRKAQK